MPTPTKDNKDAARLFLSPEMVEHLRSMHQRAKTVIGPTPPDDPARETSEALSKLLSVFAANGVLLEELDRALGTYPGAVRLRLIRHGYIPGRLPPGGKLYGTPHPNSAGSHRRPPPNRLDITGQRYGILTAIEPTGESTRLGRLWRFRCDCGRDGAWTAAAVRAGRVASCGCRGRGRNRRR